MDTDTYPNADVVKALNDGYVCWKADAEKDAGLTQELHVGRLPAYAFLDAGGEVIMMSVGFLEPKAFLEELKKPADEQKKYEDQKAGLAKTPDDPKLNYEMGVSLLRRNKKEDGFKLFDKAAQLDPDNKAGVADKIALARVEDQIDNQAFADAEKAVQAVIEKYKTSDQLAKAYLFLGWAQIQQQREEEAMKTWKAGVERYPDAAESKQAQSLMQRIQEQKKEQPGEKKEEKSK